MHWCYLNTKSLRRYSAFKNTYWNALVGPWHKSFSVNLSYQKCKLTCLGGTLPKNLFGDFQLTRILMNMHWWNITQTPFGDFQLSRILIDMHWRDFNTKSFQRFSANKNTYWHALMGPEDKIFSTIFSYQEYLLTCIGVTWTQNRYGDIQLSRTPIEMHWWDLDTKAFRWI